MIITKIKYLIFFLVSIVFVIKPMIQVARGVSQQEINRLQRDAQKSDINAILRLAKLYLEGKGIEQDVHKAIKLYEKAIEEKEDVIAMMALAKLYFKGKDIQDVDKAIQLYEKAIEKEDVNAMMALAKLYLERKDIQDADKAIQLYEKAIKKEHVTAMMALAKLYLEEKGIEQDIPKAIELYEKAIKKENVTAMMALAKLYLERKDIQDVDKAIQLYEKAIKKEHVDSMIGLAKLYLERKDIQDVDKAIQLYEKAIEKEYAPAMMALAKLYLERKDIQDVGKAIQLYEKAIEKKNANAMITLANLYLEGKDIEQDVGKAIQLYEKSIKKEDITAMMALAKLYLEGKGIEQDVDQAIELYKKAINGRSIKAKIRLGNLYLHGEYSVPQDPYEAFLLFHDAIESIDRKLREVNITENEKEIVELYKALAEQGLKEAIAKDTPSSSSDQHSYREQTSLNQEFISGTSSSIQPIFQWVWDLQTGFQEDLALAQSGDAQKAFEVGLCYHFGLGTLPDSKLAMHWLEFAKYQGKEEAGFFIDAIRSIDHGCNLSESIHFALQGDPIFSFFVAQRYHYGLGIQFDLAQAELWYQRAKVQGHILAQEQLRSLEEQGGSQLDPNLLKALHFFHRASALDLESLELLCPIFPIQHPGKLAPDRKQLLQRLAVQTSSFFAPYLSVCSSKWEGIEACRQRAYRGDREAWYQLGEWYYDGDHANKNLDRAIMYWNRAAEMGHRGAMFRMGEWYWTRRGSRIQSNFQIAVRYFQQAIAGQTHPNPAALHYLAIAYFRGRGVVRNIVEAIRFLHQAAHQGDYLAQIRFGEMNWGAGIIQQAWRRYRIRQEHREPNLFGTYMRGMATRIQRAWRRYQARIDFNQQYRSNQVLSFLGL